MANNNHNSHIASQTILFPFPVVWTVHGLNFLTETSTQALPRLPLLIIYRGHPSPFLTPNNVPELPQHFHFVCSFPRGRALTRWKKTEHPRDSLV